MEKKKAKLKKKGKEILEKKKKKIKKRRERVRKKMKKNTKKRGEKALLINVVIHSDLGVVE